jgi:phospholipid/cholesterol/gamma-HCH transport system permease protein
MPEVLSNSTARFELHSGNTGAPVLSLSGRLDSGSTAELWKEIEARLRQSPVARLEVDASGVDYCDGAGLALLSFLRMGGMSPPDAKVTVRGLRAEFENLFQRFTREDYERNRPASPEKIRAAEETGAAVIKIARDVGRSLLSGREAAAGMVANLSRAGGCVGRRSRAFYERRRQRAPYRVADQSARRVNHRLRIGRPVRDVRRADFHRQHDRHRHGAGAGTLDDRYHPRGPLWFCVCGELGTMKVNEELNALETMGLNPIRFLVAQRILAGMLLTPLLCIYSIVVGIGGGVLVMLTMDFPFRPSTSRWPRLSTIATS